MSISHMIYLKKEFEPVVLCEGWDSNPRTPTRMDPKSIAFDLTGLPSHFVPPSLQMILIT